MSETENFCCFFDVDIVFFKWYNDRMTAVV